MYNHMNDEKIITCVIDWLHVTTLHNMIQWFPIKGSLTLKHRETHGCVVSTVATDALVLKHQAISILSTD